jgi:protein-S-isoprenylcysteine O-methyltransferase Ste14
MTHNVFKLVYFIELVLISFARRAAPRRVRRLAAAEKHTSPLETLLLYLSTFANLLPLIFVFTTWLDFANYQLPSWIGWLGAIVFAFSGYLVWQTHRDLGRSWTPALRFHDGDYLITDGIFETLRFPIYASHLLWGIAQMLMLHNWIAGFAYLVTITPRILLRIKNEEQTMLEEFGDEYREYMENTGGIIPKLS